jgi:hypothetical protein
LREFVSDRAELVTCRLELLTNLLHLAVLPRGLGLVSRDRGPERLQFLHGDGGGGLLEQHLIPDRGQLVLHPRDGFLALRRPRVRARRPLVRFGQIRPQLGDLPGLFQEPELEVGGPRLRCGQSRARLLQHAAVLAQPRLERLDRPEPPFLLCFQFAVRGLHRGPPLLQSLEFGSRRGGLRLELGTHRLLPRLRLGERRGHLRLQLCPRRCHERLRLRARGGLTGLHLRRGTHRVPLRLVEVVAGLLQLTARVVEARMRTRGLDIGRVEPFEQFGLASLGGRGHHLQLLRLRLRLRRAREQLVPLTLGFRGACFQLDQTLLQPIGGAPRVLRHVLDPCFERLRAFVGFPGLG